MTGPKKTSAVPAGHGKLKRLGVELPLLPVTGVGSLPKPPDLLQSQAKAAQGLLFSQEIEAQEKRATEFWIRFQDQAGADVLVDGEMYRGNMVSYFADKLPGFYPGGLVRVYGNRYHRKPVVVGEVRWPGPITVKWWRFAQGLTAKPVKAVVTGPYTLMDRSFNEYHPTREAACLALAQVVRQEVEALCSAGAKIVQIDEPALSVRREDVPWIRESLRRVTEKLPAYFILHICQAPAEDVHPQVLKFFTDNYDFEMTRTAGGFPGLLKKHPLPRDISVGVVDSYSSEIESAAAIRRRLRPFLSRLHPRQIWVDPDCGLKYLAVEEAKSKIAAMVQAVKSVRNTLKVQ